jgi:tetratricopeptide (TPR) repeat protein
MAKSPDERYETAGDFAQDLERVLESRPIVARRPGPLKRAVQWGRRHRPVVWAAAIVLALAAVGFALSSVVIWHAYEHEAVAHERSRRNLELAMLALDEIYFEEALDQMERTPLLTEADRRFLERGLHFFDAFVEENAGNEFVRRQTAQAYWKAADIRTKLGNHAEAIDSARQAVSILAALCEEDPSSEVVLLNLSHCYEQLGEALSGVGELSEAEEAYQRSREIREALLSKNPRSAAYRSAVASSLSTLASIRREYGDLSAARRGYEDAVALQGQAADAEPGSLDRRRLLVAHLANLGRLQFDLGEYGEAEQSYRRALDLIKAVVDEPPVVLGHLHLLSGVQHGLGIALMSAGRLPEAENHFREAVAVSREVLRQAPNRISVRSGLAVLLSSLGACLCDFGKNREALEALDESVTILEEMVTQFPDVPVLRHNLAIAHMNRSPVLAALDDPNAACVAGREGITVCQELVDRFGALPLYLCTLAKLRLGLGRNLIAVGEDWASAEDALVKARDQLQELVRSDPESTDHVDSLARAHADLGNVYAAMARWPAAIDCCRDAMEILDRPGQRLDRASKRNEVLSEVVLRLADILERDPQTKPDEREALYQRAIAILEGLAEDRGLPKERGYRWRAHSGYAGLLFDSQRMEEAQAQLEKARRLIEEWTGDPSAARPLHELLHIHALSGSIACARGDLEETLAQLQQATRIWEAIGPTTVRHRGGGWLRRLHWLLAQMYHRRGQHEEAIATLEQGLELGQDSASLQSLLGWFYLFIETKELRNPKRGLALLEQAHKVCPDDPSTTQALVWAYLNPHYEEIIDFERAVPLLERMLEKTPNDVNLQDWLAYAYVRAGKNLEAVSAYAKLDTLKGGLDAGDWMCLAMAKHRLGHKREARVCFDKGVAIMRERQRHYDAERRGLLNRLRAEAESVLGIGAG